MQALHVGSYTDDNEFIWLAGREIGARRLDRPPASHRRT
jgi:hypothetical protein